jgi:hypothetical protein
MNKLGCFKDFGGQGISGDTESYKSIVERTVRRKLPYMSKLIDGRVGVN